MNIPAISQGDAARALSALTEPFCDFPYPKEPHRYVPVAAILSLLARPAIRGACPGFLFDAATRGSGKTLQADVVGLVTTGRTTAKKNYPVDDVELEKVLAGYAMGGAALVNFDNVARCFGGAALDLCLTAEDTVELRPLGKTEIRRMKWRAVILATGNNLTLAGDTARRVLISRIESPDEHPEDRTDFKHPDLLGWVRSHRVRLVRAGLAVLQGFCAAGRPDVGLRPWGSFGPWTALVPAAIVWAGGANVLEARPTAEGHEEPEKAALSVLLREMPRLDPGNVGMTAKAIVGALYPLERLKGQASPDGWEDMRDAVESLAPGKPGQAPPSLVLGKALGKAKGRVIGGRKLAGDTGRGGVLRWKSQSA